MQSLINHARGFPAKIADRQEEFAKLARGQRPQALFISCSDSRVMPSLFTGARPGELFELRTAGNIVPRYRPQATCGVAGTLEFAVTALDVPDIVLCGHSHCGAVQGLIRRQTVQAMPLVERWLTVAGHRPAFRTTGPRPLGQGARTLARWPSGTC
jgi:carbonic anhydrase